MKTKDKVLRWITVSFFVSSILTVLICMAEKNFIGAPVTESWYLFFGIFPNVGWASKVVIGKWPHQIWN